MKEKIVEVAKSYIGKTEISGNKGFNDKTFEKRMKDTGWYSGLSWCAFFAELVWKEAYAESSLLVKKLDKLFSGSATTTYKNFDLSPDFNVSAKPVPGALAVWRYGNGWQGHIGVVSEVLKDDTFKCIEGNTNDMGGREGYIVAEKHRKLVKPYQPKGLNLIGFVLPV